MVYNVGITGRPKYLATALSVRYLLY